jgi:hypothetical protein
VRGKIRCQFLSANGFDGLVLQRREGCLPLKEEALRKAAVKLENSQKTCIIFAKTS